MTERLSQEEREELGRLWERSEKEDSSQEEILSAQWALDELLFGTEETDAALPALVASAERLEKAERALQEIEVLSARGPHISAEEGFKAVWKALDKARAIASAALNGETDK